MNIAFYHATLPGGRSGKEGGVSYVVHRLANTLAGRGHGLTMFSYDPAPPDALYEARRLPLRRWGELLPGRLTITPLVLNALDLRGFDVMHAHGDDHFALRRPLPWVRTLYGSAKRERQSAVRLRRRLSQTVLIPLEALSSRLADVTIGISHDTAVCVPGIDEVIPCGVDLSLFRPASTPRAAFPAILFVGTVRGRKRGDLLLQVFQRQIRPARPDAELWMVCEPGEPRDGVYWCGKVSTERLVELYQQCWTFCLPSSYEGFGVPYVEALACATPVVASPNPGAREVLRDGRDGVLAGDDDLGAALLALLSDAERRSTLSEVGLARASDFDWNLVAQRYEEVYRQAQARHVQRRSGRNVEKSI